VETLTSDVTIVDAGGTGLRAAKALAESNPGLRIALISKVYPSVISTMTCDGIQENRTASWSVA
jgi:fumarate reductase flavoprotein subunit